MFNATRISKAIQSANYFLRLSIHFAGNEPSGSFWTSTCIFHVLSNVFSICNNSMNIFISHNEVKTDKDTNKSIPDEVIEA